MALHPSRKEIESSLQSIITKSIGAGVPGISAQITSASKGTLWTCTDGYVDLKIKEPVATKHLFGIGSITKVFVTVVILQLVEEKRLRVDDTVGQLLDQEIYHGIENASKATIEELLSHTAGVDSWEDDPIWIVQGRGKELNPKKIWSSTGKIFVLEHGFYVAGPDCREHYRTVRRGGDSSTDS
jgi:D-alanyl-D-alanine carboxypeptidase